LHACECNYQWRYEADGSSRLRDPAGFEAAGLASAPYGELLRSRQPRLSFARRLPVGVVGVIAPFNVPIVLAIRAVAPALALGNAVILKPDPRRAVSGGVVLARIFEEGAGGTYEGLFHRPTVLADVPTSAPAYAEEVFGPVAPVVSFSSVDELVPVGHDPRRATGLPLLKPAPGEVGRSHARSSIPGPSPLGGLEE
jgi:acyl-CoA reductase-like NAD-dependent aldehyde dehydrogenase